MNLKTDYINFEIAQKYNSLYFTDLINESDIKTFYYSDGTEGSLGYIEDFADVSRKDKGYILRPSHDLLFKWIRVKLGINIKLFKHYTGGYYFDLWSDSDGKSLGWFTERKIGEKIITFSTFEKAFEKIVQIILDNPLDYYLEKVCPKPISHNKSGYLFWATRKLTPSDIT